MKSIITIALLTAGAIAATMSSGSARPRGPVFGYSPPPAFEGRSAWAAGRSRAGAACTIYSCPRVYVPGVPLNPEGNIRPGGIP